MNYFSIDFNFLNFNKIMLTDFPVTGKKATRDGFGDGLLAVGEQYPNVVALCADLIGSLKMNAFIKAFPDRFIQTGIAEANMMGLPGLATAGRFIYRHLCKFFNRTCIRSDQTIDSVL
jgi:transketolase C-terminal domain/subunit